jgi:hypothetical protein
MGTDVKKPSRRKRLACMREAAYQLANYTHCRVSYDDAGFHVWMPDYLCGPEDKKVWDALDERGADLDEDAFAVEWDKVEKQLDRDRDSLTAEQAVRWLRAKYDEAAALAKKRFDEQVATFLAEAAECEADEMAKEAKRKHKLWLYERQLIKEEEATVAEPPPLAAE